MGFTPKRLPERGVLKPHETAKLKRVLEEACRRRGVLAASDEGRDLALTVLALHNAGMGDEVELINAVAFAVPRSA